MKRFEYRITVTPLAGSEATAGGSPPPLQFDVSTHDDVLALVERSRQRGDFDADAATAFTVGLKLLGEVMLKNRNHPLFEAFGPQFGEFMQRVKGSGRGGTDAQGSETGV